MYFSFFLMFERRWVTADWWHIVVWCNLMFCDWLESSGSAVSLLDTGQIQVLARQRSTLHLCIKTVLIDAMRWFALWISLLCTLCVKRNILALEHIRVQCVYRWWGDRVGWGCTEWAPCLPSNFFPGKQSMMAQQQLSYNLLVLFRYALMPSTSRQGWVGKKGWECGSGGDWINLSHRGEMAPESFGYSINHLSFTCSFPLLRLIISLCSFPSCFHGNASLQWEGVDRSHFWMYVCV